MIRRGRRRKLLLQNITRWLGSKESTCQCRRPRFDPWVGKIPWRRKWDPLQFSCLENSMNREAWRAIVHGFAKESDTTEQLNSKFSVKDQMYHPKKLKLNPLCQETQPPESDIWWSEVGLMLIAIEIKCTINVMHFNHWETVPLPICGKTVFQKISPGYPMWWSLETGPTGMIRDQCPCKRDPKDLSHPFHTWGHGISESDGKSAGTLLLASPASTPWEIITIVYKPFHL